MVATEMAAFLQNRIPHVMQWLREMAETYKERSTWKRLSVWFAEKTKALDWDEIQQVIKERIDDREGRKEMIDAVGNFFPGLRGHITSSEAHLAVRQLQDRASDLAVVILEKYVNREMPKLGHRIADDRRFWTWLSDRALPTIRPYIIAWLRGDGVEAIRGNFDVAGRVKTAVGNMDVRKVHDMINEASARHLGAIQVLGFILGLVAGGCLVVI